MSEANEVLFAECGWCGVYNDLSCDHPTPDTSWLCGWCENVFLLVEGATLTLSELPYDLTEDECPYATLCVITEDDIPTIK